MLKPKFDFDKSKREYVAQKEFTDRELPQETFFKNITVLSENLLTSEEKHQVLVYYGVGGIGKTTLKNKLKKEFLNMSNSLVMEIDFKDIRSRECASGLLNLANSLQINNNAKKIKFYNFELAYSMYFKKKNPDYSFSKDNESLFSEFDLGIEILSMFDPIGISGVAMSLVDVIYNKSKNMILDPKMKNNLKEFENMSLHDMEEWLPAYFAHDLKSYISKTGEVKIVIFLDTFEALNDFEIHDLKKNTKSNWIRELITHLPNVLFTIFGRDKISWSEEWDDYLEQHLLSELTVDYTIKFLEKCGIIEEEIRNKIAHVSNGHPYYLDLSVDTYFSIKNSGNIPSIDCFGDNKIDILDRFIRNLSNVEIELLKVMSIPNYYNYEIFTLLINKFDIPYPPTQFNSFNQYSFITKNESSKKYFVHQLMRDGMNSYIDPDLQNQINGVLFDYFEKMYLNERKEFIFHCIYHKLRLADHSDFFDWIVKSKIEYIKQLQLLGETVLLSSIFGEIRQIYEIEQFDIRLFNIYEDMIHLSGNYKESVRLSESFLKKFDEKDIFSNKDLIRLKFRIIHHKMFYINSDELIQELSMMREKISIDSFLLEYCEVTYMLGGGVGFLTGKLEESKGYLDSLVNIIDSQTNYNQELQHIYLRSMRKIVDYYRIVGEFDKAEDICIKNLKKEELNRYQIYLLCSYGEILRAKREYDSAMRCFEKVLSETRSLGIKGWIAHAYLSIANLKIDIGDFYQAKNLIDNAKHIYEEISHQWGIVNTNIMISRILISENFEEAINLLNCTKGIAELYSYRYEIKIIDEIINTNDIGSQQLLYV